MSVPPTELIGDNILTSKGITASVSAAISAGDFSGKLFAFYFSAHWCPPCRQFTPLLNTTYLTWAKASKPIEIVFVSSDQDDESFDEYYGTMNFKAIPYSDEDKRQQLGEKFGIRGIPALIVVDAAGNIVSKDGRADVMKHKDGALDHWLKAAESAK